MANLLPAFLTPFKHTSSANLTFQSAQFTHNGSLSSSHVLWWPPLRDAEPEVLLFFIPGNPGLVDFYIPFLSEIHGSQVSSSLAVVAQAHLDHYPGIHNDAHARYRPEESLTIQIQNSLDLLEAIDAYYARKPRIIVVGHSVGCWISLQVLKSLPEDRVEATFLLTPTISNISDTPNGKSLFPIFWPISRSILASLSFMARLIPAAVLSTIYPAWPPSQLHVLRQFISSRTSIHASLNMGAEEMKSIRALDVATIKKFKHNLYFYYANTDRWVGKEREVVLQAFDPNNESAQIVHGPNGVPHAFCINDSEPVAKQCCEWLAKMLEPSA